MSAPQYIGLIAALIWVGGCSTDMPGIRALSEWASIGLGIVAVALSAVLYFV